MHVFYMITAVLLMIGTQQVASKPTKVFNRQSRMTVSLPRCLVSCELGEDAMDLFCHFADDYPPVAIACAVADTAVFAYEMSEHRTLCYSFCHDIFDLKTK